MNRLAQEKSPYLQMHAANPIDWYPWGPEALNLARRLDRPIFLSIGYSSCHWCHVIARESFEDAKVAEALNRDYVSVKVDKEERPDLDAVYMDAVTLATGSGGWPMTLLLTPECAPFFAASYLTREQLLDLLPKAAKAWRSNGEALRASAAGFLTHLRKAAALCPAPAPFGMPLLRDAKMAYAALYDPAFGGFGRAPKFPAAHNLLFLLAYHDKTGDREALEMAESTLTAMAQGGIFDHVGGGFCRYSVDEKWLVPHFEKMLYDNALLLWAYAEAGRVTKNPFYLDVARRTLQYVLREMTGPEGQFYSAQDADSKGGEGAYYLLDRGEIIALLGPEEGERFCDHYGILPGGNFEGRSIPNRIGKETEDETAFAASRETVYDHRKRRMPLRRDDKVLTAWNALMICALCQAARALDDPACLRSARQAEAFLRRNLMHDGGKLAVRWRDGERKGEAVLADYAYYTLALLMLQDAVPDAGYADQAKALARVMLDEFSDPRNGGFFLYGRNAEQLITRPKETWDASVPSGNSAAALALLCLSRIDPAFREAADRQLRFMAGAAKKEPVGHGFALLALLHALT